MRIKKTIVTQFISNFDIKTTGLNEYVPKAGDIALFEIIETGKHQTVQSDSKRNVAIFPGDLILAAFADRYATSQFEGYVPEKALDEYHILGAGGAIGIVKSKNAALKDIEPTTVRCVGLAVDQDNQIINSKFYGIDKPLFNKENHKVPTILSLGATMDSGKTTTAAFVSRGLNLDKKNVGFIKMTGTAYTKDKDFVLDCGAIATLDFSDAGYPSTFTSSIDEILSIYEYLVAKLTRENKLDYIVIEIADGILQQETMALISRADFMSTIDHVVFSCGDSLSALKGLEILESINIHPKMLCGKFTMSELLIREVQALVNIPIFGLPQLENMEANPLFK
jgi:hypothetical protein